MNKHLKPIIQSVVLLLFFAPSVKGQKTKTVDSLTIYLNNIKTPADTNIIYKVFEWLYKCEEDILLTDDVMNKIGQLKNKVDEDDYYDIATIYFYALINKDTPASNEKAIAVMQQWLAQNENSKSKYGHYNYLNILRDLRHPFRNSGKLNECIEYFTASEKKYLSVQDSEAVSIVYNVLASSYNKLGLIEKAKYYQLKSIAFLNNSQKDYNIHFGATSFGISGKVNRFAVLGSYYIEQKKPNIAIGYLNEAIKFYNQLDEPMLMTDAPYIFLQLARCKTLEKSNNSSRYYDTALKYMKEYNEQPVIYAHYYQEKAADYISKNVLDSALININKAIQLKDSFNLGIISSYGELLTGFYKATILIKKGKVKDAINILQSEIKEIRVLNNVNLLIAELSLLAEAYSANGDTEEAYKTLRESFLLKEQLVAEQNDARSLNFETEKKMQESENAIVSLDAQNKANQKIKYYLFGIVGLLALFLMGMAVFYSIKRKTNRELAVKNKRLSDALQQLQATQSQLIQSEKMASLGELTAGIAHEIQNPLNFVNNFSELSVDLAKELKEEVEKIEIPEKDKEYVSEIIGDLSQNQEKINHHGKRASSIVKGMLEHSRKSSGTKEPTDNNALADEYLRLAYHGLRAKNKDFNATMETHFDPNLPKIEVIPQDIGRVLLNLINNAFYAVNERSKKGEAGYQPIISITTQLIANTQLLIAIKDNGSGIPDAIKDKIFQPFFTTKPTGQGTGLGLSLAYDIVKAHGGELTIESQVGEGLPAGEAGTAFIIHIPTL
ncbi:MAG: GHKL domain-containing protein [Saprospiraceae bacterium]|nr:GHKL domain-containing protein [Saprospiraceae bacterium]MBP6567406.1 GHKL domain-containing protein [Saprospiraceae bacterium]